MSKIGYYRYKINPDVNQDVKLYINYAHAATKSIVVKEFCDDSKLLKFLDKNGQYRFYPFNRFYETKDKPKLLGKTSKIIETILNYQSESNIVGYKNERILSLIADSVSESEMLILSDIYTSPKVYLNIGEGDLIKDWVQVEIKKGKKVAMRKTKFGTIELDVILPKWFTIKMI